MDRHILFGFTNVDKTADPGLLRSLPGHRQFRGIVQQHKRRSFSLLEIKSRRRFQAGGGTGDDARASWSVPRAESTASITAGPWSMKPRNVSPVRDYPSFFKSATHIICPSPTTSSTPAAPIACSCTSETLRGRCRKWSRYQAPRLGPGLRSRFRDLGHRCPGSSAGPQDHEYLDRWLPQWLAGTPRPGAQETGYSMYVSIPRPCVSRIR